MNTVAILYRRSKYSFDFKTMIYLFGVESRLLSAN